MVQISTTLILAALAVTSALALSVSSQEQAVREVGDIEARGPIGPGRTAAAIGGVVARAAEAALAERDFDEYLEARQQPANDRHEGNNDDRNRHEPGSR